MKEPRHKAHIDFETASEADLPDVGTDRYAKDKSTRALMVAWSLDDEPVQQWSEDDFAPFPPELKEMVRDPSVQKIAHNAQFERAIFRDVIKLDSPVQHWRCTMAWAYMLGLPGALKKLGEVLRLPEDMQKMDAGMRLIRKFSKPRKPTKNKNYRWSGPDTDPEDWSLFLKYNRQDVETERFVEKRLSRFPVTPDEWVLWFIDQEINERGWPIDREMVYGAYDLVQEETARLLNELRALTGLDNPNSDAQFGPWIRERGYEFGDMRKDTVRRAAEDEFSALTTTARRGLELRASLKRTSVKKYETIRASMAEDDRLRFTFQFCGASRTGRWAGRVAQFHNLAKPPKDLEDPAILADIIDAVRQRDYEWIRQMYGDPIRALSGVIRGTVRAREGHKLIVADLAAIESRVIAWLARCPALLQVFYDGLDPYKAFATIMYAKAYDDVTKAERNMSKPPVLGCGFRLSGGEEIVDRKTGDLKKTGLWGYAAGMGIHMARDEAHASVKIFRDAYPEIVQLWYDLENAAKDVVLRDGEKWVGYLKFDRAGPFLRIRLPSGRYLHYLRPKVEMRETPYGKVKPTLTFEGMEDNGERKFWGRIPTHGGVLAENVTQAVANDVLRNGIVVARRQGFPIVGHVHDEIVSEVPLDSALTVADLCAAMSAPVTWGEKLPLAAAGYETIFYRKD